MASSDIDILCARLEALLPMERVAVKPMFGGRTFMLDGHMLVCASRKGLMARVGAAAEAEALKSPHTEPCLGAGRPMPGFLMIAPEGLADEAALTRWVGLARAYVETLSAKPAKSRRDHP
jgi:TfoX/Sxy family transcriptional regulator of competence genes